MQLLSVKISLGFVFMLSALFIQAQTNSTYKELILSADTIWHYFEGNTEAPANWFSTSYNPSDWKTGKGGFGYGDDDDKTLISPVHSVYFRREFKIFSLTNLNALMLYLDYDDGYVVYVNGTEVSRSAGVTGTPPAYNSGADLHEALMYSGGIPKRIIIPKELLIQGDNLLAIQVLNNAISSSDLTSNAYLVINHQNSFPLYEPIPEWLKTTNPLENTGSKLPIVLIQTNDYEAIPDEPKIDANMGIVNNPDELNYINNLMNEYNGRIGIELRGQSSLRKWDKTSFGLETRTELGENNNIPLFEFAKENDWVLNACMYDRSFIRMPLTFHLARKMGRYATKTKLCEVLVNDEYQGVYIFMEKAKRDKNRVDISKMAPTDISGENLTGGYLIEYSSSRWGIPAHFEFHYPKEEDLVPEQEQYMLAYMDNLLSVLKSPNYDDPVSGYQNLIDIPSFVDEIIIQEISKSQDAYRYSSYFSKDRGEKLKAGPAWDFDQSYGNSLSYATSGFLVSSVPADLIWSHLFKIYGFKLEIAKRWQELRQGPFMTDSLLNFVDEKAALLDEAKDRNFDTWDVLGKKLWREPDVLVGVNYPEEIAYMKTWITERCQWLDNYFGTVVSMHEISQPAKSNAYYAHSRRAICVELEPLGTQNIELKIVNLQGITLTSRHIKNANSAGNAMIATDGFAPGVYLCVIQSAAYSRTHKVVVR